MKPESRVNKVCFEEINFKTSSELEWKDLTPDVQRCIQKSGMHNGIVSVFVPGSTGSVISIEAEGGLLNDLISFVCQAIPPQGVKDYEHERAWRDGNGHSHLRATLLGANVTIPFANTKLQIGTWQQIVFLEFDIRPRKRKVLVHCFGI